MSPKSRYVRYRTLSRLRHSNQMIFWLEEQAERLGYDVAYIWNTLLVQQGMTVEQVSAMENPGPENTVAPAITGTLEVGQTLTVSNGTWTGEGSITYSRQWYVGGVLVPDATGATFVLPEYAEGEMVQARVRATDDNGHRWVDADAVGPIEPEV